MKDLYNIAVDCLEKQAKKKPHHTALIVIQANASVKRYSFAAIERQVNRWSHFWQAQSLNPGDRILLRLPNGPLFPIVFLSCIKSGLIPVPTSPLLTAEELAFLKEDSAAPWIVTVPELVPPHKRLKNSFLVFDSAFEKKLTQYPSAFKTKPTQAEAPAYWLYTSGTTGEPKAVIHAHRSIRAHDERLKLWMNLKKTDRVWNTGAMNWSYTLTCGLLDLWRHGVTAITAEKLPDPEAMLQSIQRLSITTLLTVPGVYRRLLERLEHKPLKKNSLRVCLSAGEKLDEGVRKTFHRQTGLWIHEGLGMTEHSVYLVQPYGQKIGSGASGRALPSTKIAIVKVSRSKKKPVTVLPAGCLGVVASHRSSEGLMLGYHQRPAEEAKVFQGSWFLSGDLAVRDKKGYIHFFGRGDDVINAGGYRISPLEVEKALNQCPGILESAAVGEVLGKGRTIVVAYLVSQKTLSDDVLRKHLSRHLASYKIPRKFIFVDSLPKTATGKIKRKFLKTLKIHSTPVPSSPKSRVLRR